MHTYKNLALIHILVTTKHHNNYAVVCVGVEECNSKFVVGKIIDYIQLCVSIVILHLSQSPCKAKKNYNH